MHLRAAAARGAAAARQHVTSAALVRCRSSLPPPHGTPGLGPGLLHALRRGASATQPPRRHVRRHVALPSACATVAHVRTRARLLSSRLSSRPGATCRAKRAGWAGTLKARSWQGPSSSRRAWRPWAPHSFAHSQARVRGRTHSDSPSPPPQGAERAAAPSRRFRCFWLTRRAQDGRCHHGRSAG